MGDMVEITRTAQTLLAIARLRAGPQDLPYSPGLLGLLIVLTAAINTPVMARYTPQADPLLQLLLLVAFNAAFIGLILAVRGHWPRFVQTASALFGTDAIISAVALPVLLAIGSPDQANALAALAFVALLIWNIAVVGHIIRSALAIPFAFGIGIGVLYIFGVSAFVRMISGA